MEKIGFVSLGCSKNLIDTEVSKVEDTTLNSSVNAAKKLYDAAFKSEAFNPKTFAYCC